MDIVQIAGVSQPEIMAELSQELSSVEKSVCPDDQAEDPERFGHTYIIIG